MRCIVGGYFGERTRPYGLTQYLRYLLENPPEGVEYVIPADTVKWLNTEYYKTFLGKQKTVQLQEKRYYKHFKLLTDRIGWRLPELVKIKVDSKEDYDMLFYNMSVVLSSPLPYISCLEGDFILTNNPKTCILRDYLNMNTIPARVYQRTILKHILLKKNLKKILFWSDKGIKETLKLFPEIEEKSGVLRPPIKIPERVKTREGDKVRLFFVGRDWINKGLLLLTEVFSKLRRRYDIELSVVTSRTFQVFEPDQSIKVFYELPYEQLFPALYLESDIFVLPTRFETFGYCILEAMACGLPVVTSNVYSIPETVDDGETGYLTEYGDMEALEEKLVELIENAPLRKKMGEAGRKKAEEKFSLPVFKGELAKVYEESLRF